MAQLQVFSLPNLRHKQVFTLCYPRVYISTNPHKSQVYSSTKQHLSQVYINNMEEQLLAPLGRFQVYPSTSQHHQYQLCSMVSFPRQPQVFNSNKLHKTLAIMAVLSQVFSILHQHLFFINISILLATSLDMFKHQGRLQVGISSSKHLSQVCSLGPFIVYTSIFLRRPLVYNNIKLHKPIILKVVQALAYSILHSTLLSNLVQATNLLSYCIHRAATSNPELHNLVPRFFLIMFSLYLSTMVYNLVFKMCTSSSLHNPSSHNKFSNLHNPSTS